MPCSPGEWSLIDCPVVQSSGMSSGQWFWGSVPRSLQLGQSMWDIERTEGMKDVVRGTYRRHRLWYHHSWEPGRIVRHQQMLIQVQRPGWGPFDQVHSAAHTGNQLAGDDVRGQRALLLWPCCYFWKLPSVHRCLLEERKNEREGKEVLKDCALCQSEWIKTEIIACKLTRKKQHHKMEYNRLCALGLKSWIQIYRRKNYILVPLNYRVC